LLFVRVEIQESSAHVIIDLAASVFPLCFRCRSARFRLRDVALDPPASEDRNPHSCLDAEVSIRVTECRPDVAVIAIHSYGGVALAPVG